METLQILLVAVSLASAPLTTVARPDGPAPPSFPIEKTFTIRHVRFNPGNTRDTSGRIRVPPQPLQVQRRPGLPVGFRVPSDRLPLPQRIINTKVRTSQNLAAPQQSSGQPQQFSGQPQQSSGQPQQSSDQPQQSSGQPQQSSDQPQRRPYLPQGAGAPPQNQYIPVAPPQEGGGVDTTSRRDPKCGLLPPTGDCRAAFPRFYYNTQTDQCDCFLYGGCGSSGLDYSYGTLEECQASCLPSNMEEGPVCQEVFQDDDETYFDVPDLPAPSSAGLPAPAPPPPTPSAPGIENIPDDVLFSLLVNAVSPEDIVDSGRYREGQRDKRPGGSF